MVLNHSEVCLIMVRQGIVTQRYPKKESIPSIIMGVDFLHFPHSQSIVWLSLGIDSKNSLTLTNCEELRDSIKSFSSFLVESFALYISSPSQMYSIQSIISLNTFSASISSPAVAYFCTVSICGNFNFSPILSVIFISEDVILKYP